MHMESWPKRISSVEVLIDNVMRKDLNSKIMTFVM